MKFAPTLLSIVLGLAACSTKPVPGPPAPMGMDASSGADVVESADASEMGTPDAGVMPTDVGAAATAFKLRIENVSDTAILPTAFAPGVWAVHGIATPLFTEGEPDKGQGLEALAEDGDPAALLTALPSTEAVISSGALGDAALMPGEMVEVTLGATPDAPMLSFASMLVQSNDLIVAGPATGLFLFDPMGMPIAETDVTDMLSLWDVGTEVNEAPGQGINQAPRQSEADTGPAEGVVHVQSGATRSLPLGRDIIEFSVTRLGDRTVEITVNNRSAAKGPLSTSISAAFWAVHSDIWQLFTPGSAAGRALEELAEDGFPEALQTEHESALGVLAARAESGKAGPGESYTFEVTADPNQPFLSIAIHIAETNDAFLAFRPAGVRILDEDGNLRGESELAADLNRSLVVWDAGTEKNEVPGIGENQSARQIGSVGDADPEATVRVYSDAVNDLGGAAAAGLARLSVTSNPDGTFSVALENTSDDTDYPTPLSPLVWMLHDGALKAFTPGGVATPALESLAEDGDPNPLKGELNVQPNATVEVVRIPDGAPAVAAILPGERFAFSITPTVDQPTFNLLSMVVESNDTFLALGTTGITLLDSSGAPRSDGDIAMDIAMQLALYDAGTEGNQAGGAGPDQAPRQATENRGPPEGTGNVRKHAGDVWSYPAVNELVKVTIIPE